MKNKIAVLVCTFIIIFPNGIACPGNDTIITLESLIKEALNNNPEVQVAYDEWVE